MISIQKPIGIFGAGGFGREVYMLLQQLNARHPQWQIKGFFDDKWPAAQTVQDLPILGSAETLNQFPYELYIALGIGCSTLRAEIASKLQNPNLYFPVLKHPTVEIFPFQGIRIDEGSIICAGNIFTTDIIIGKFVIINLACTIGHDVIIEDFVSMMPGCHISGNVKILENAYLGTGAVVLNGITIGRGAKVGAGAVVTQDVPDFTTVVGVPAKIVSKKEVI